MILAVDVGKGTEDILIIDPKTGPNENSIQAVLPSQAQLLYRELENETNPNWFFSGTTMAGEPWHKLVYKHAATNGNSVTMTETSARSLRYHVDQVVSKGIVIADKPQYEDSASFVTADVNWYRILCIIKNSGLDPLDIETILLACQDHGEPPNSKQSSRDFRMKTIYSDLGPKGRLSDLIYNISKIPNYLPRHKAIALSALDAFDEKTEVMVMDSSPAVVLGTKSNIGKEIIINVGNGHTLAVVFQQGLAQAVYETHTGGVDPEGMLGEIQLLLKGELNHERALERGGHGVFMRDEFDTSKGIDEYTVSVIGPRRNIFENHDLVFRFPLSNMMMAGPLGLFRAYQSSKLPKRS